MVRGYGYSKQKSGGVRVCVDLKPLSHCVFREYHPLPKVDEVLAQLTGAVMFSKLDANSGFLAGAVVQEIQRTDSLHYPFWQILPQQVTFRDHKCF